MTSTKRLLSVRPLPAKLRVDHGATALDASSVRTNWRRDSEGVVYIAILSELTVQTQGER